MALRQRGLGRGGWCVDGRHTPLLFWSQRLLVDDCSWNLAGPGAWDMQVTGIQPRGHIQNREVCQQGTALVPHVCLPGAT